MNIGGQLVKAVQLTEDHRDVAVAVESSDNVLPRMAKN